MSQSLQADAQFPIEVIKGFNPFTNAPCKETLYLSTSTDFDQFCRKLTEWTKDCATELGHNDGYSLENGAWFYADPNHTDESNSDGLFKPLDESAYKHLKELLVEANKPFHDEIKITIWHSIQIAQREEENMLMQSEELKDLLLEKRDWHDA